MIWLHKFINTLNFGSKKEICILGEKIKEDWEREREREGKKKIDLSQSPPNVVQKDIVLMCVCFSLQSGRHGEDLGDDIWCIRDTQ